MPKIIDLAGAVFEKFVELYIAYFNRAPDAEGLFFRGSALNDVVPFEEIVTLLFDQDETRALHPGIADLENPIRADPATFITDVYGNVLGRPFDREGFDFWLGVLDRGDVSLPTFMLEIIEGAKPPPPPGATLAFIAQKAADVAHLMSKTGLGIDFAVIRGMSDVDNARDVMADFDGSFAAVLDARDRIDAALAQALEPDTGEFPTWSVWSTIRPSSRPRCSAASGETQAERWRSSLFVAIRPTSPAPAGPQVMTKVRRRGPGIRTGGGTEHQPARRRGPAAGGGGPGEPPGAIRPGERTAMAG